MEHRGVFLDFGVGFDNVVTIFNGIVFERDEYYERVTAFSNSLEPNEHLASSGQPKLMSQRVREKLIFTLQLPGSGQDWEHFLLGGGY